MCDCHRCRMDDMACGAQPKESAVKFDLLNHPQVRLAWAVASEAHDGQVDKVQVPYIEHLHWVASHVRPATPRTQAVALLHDVIEDTPVTAEDLLGRGLDAGIVDDVRALTKINGQSIEAYRQRVLARPVAAVVKIADTLHNLDQSRGWGPKMPSKKKDEYHRNLLLLTEFVAGLAPGDLFQ